MVGEPGGETKVTAVTCRVVPKVCFPGRVMYYILIEVAERACTSAARIAAGAACARGS
jgi:hypothetical protein